MVPLSLKVHGMLVGGREARVCLEGGREAVGMLVGGRQWGRQMEGPFCPVIDAANTSI